MREPGLTDIEDLRIPLFMAKMNYQPSKDGSSMENAVIIENDEKNFEGVEAEYRYLSNLFGDRGVGWNLKKQSLVKKNGHYYDFIEIKLKDGRELSLYFDITSFFKKR